MTRRLVAGLVAASALAVPTAAAAHDQGDGHGQGKGNGNASAVRECKAERRDDRTDFTRRYGEGSRGIGVCVRQVGCRRAEGKPRFCQGNHGQAGERGRKHRANRNGGAGNHRGQGGQNGDREDRKDRDDRGECDRSDDRNGDSSDCNGNGQATENPARTCRLLQENHPDWFADGGRYAGPSGFGQCVSEHAPGHNRTEDHDNGTDDHGQQDDDHGRQDDDHGRQDDDHGQGRQED